MTGEVEITIRFKCLHCGDIVEKTYYTSIGYIHDIVRCHSCGARYRIRINTSLAPLPLQDIEKELDSYEEWLIRKKRILSAHQYRLIVSRKLDDPRYFPRTISPLEYFVEYITEKYGGQIGKMVKSFLF